MSRTTRIGVFVCHCGLNIAGTIDVERVVEALKHCPGVVFATDYQYMCSDPGQNLVQKTIQDQELDGVVVAACSPAMHEATFRRAAAAAGLNPYRLEIANIREQVAWPHQSTPGQATQKAIRTVRTLVEKVRRNEALTPLSLPVTKRALVVGGGIAGLTAALDIAEAGYPVVLVERSHRLGGRVARLAPLYLTFDNADDLLAERLQAVSQHPLITVHTEAEVTGFDGYIGNFEVEVTPTSSSPDRVSQGLAQERAALSAQRPAVFDVGAVILATGFDLYPKQRIPEYGGDRDGDVIDSMTFEQMLRTGDVRRPSDGRVPTEIVWVQCAGSRSPEQHRPYCSKICCMAAAKQTIAYRQAVPQGQAYVFYIDIRSQGRGYDEFVQRAMEESEVVYLRGKVSKIVEKNGKLQVWGADTLSGRSMRVEAGLVVLMLAAVPSRGNETLARLLRVTTDEGGFFSEAHPKLQPVESLTRGVYLAGGCQFPKDIPETVSQASATAAKVLRLFCQDDVTQEPTVAHVVEQICSGCGTCVEVCPYQARELHPRHRIALVNPALCQNCGACVVACPNKASRIYNWTSEQILAMADAAVGTQRH